MEIEEIAFACVTKFQNLKNTPKKSINKNRMLDLTKEQERSIKKKQGFVKGDRQVCVKCFNVGVDASTGEAYCGLGNFMVDEQDTCNQWIPLEN